MKGVMKISRVVIVGIKWILKFESWAVTV